MPVPTHNISCKSKAIHINCDDCKEFVWYFSCSCGSKLFFNELGYPWDIHYCKEYAIKKDLELLVDIDRLSTDEIYKAIIKREKLSDFKVPDIILEIIESVIGKRRSKLEIIIDVPKRGNTEISGKVLVLNNINIYSRLGYEQKSEMSDSLLGKLAKSSWYYAKVRTNADKRNQCIETEVLMTDEYLSKNKLRQNDFIVGVAQGTVHAKGIFWQLVKHDNY